MSLISANYALWGHGLLARQATPDLDDESFSLEFSSIPSSKKVCKEEVPQIFLATACGPLRNAIDSASVSVASSHLTTHADSKVWLARRGNDYLHRDMHLRSHNGTTPRRSLTVNYIALLHNA